MQPRDDAEAQADAQAEVQVEAQVELGADAPKRRRVLLFALVAAVVLGLDVISKVLVVAKLPEGEHKRILGGAIYLDQTRNSGAAFSLGTGFTAILTVIALAVVVIIIRSASRLRSTGWAVALGLVLGGAVGNLIDRLARQPGIGRGHVVDWISVFAPDGQRWPIFNLADSGIVCGAILAGLLAMLGVEFDGRRQVGPRQARHRQAGHDA